MSVYINNIQRYKTKSAALSTELKGVSTWRLGVFLLSVIIILILANEKLIVPLLLVVPVCILAFVLIVKRYSKLSLEKQHVDFLLEINEDELLRQENGLSGFPSGQMFVNRNHPFVSDFDIFGTHSLFQLINRTTTEFGQSLLARWLGEPASRDEILERQKAVKELTPKIDWRQDFQASGMRFNNEKSAFNKLLTWIEKPAKLLPHQFKYLVISILLSILSTSAAAYFLYGLLSEVTFSFYYILPLVISLFINRRILKTTRHISEEIIDSTHANIKTLGGYQALIDRIETEEFDSVLLQRLRSVFNQNSYSASKEINGLRTILEIFQTKGTKGSIGKNDFYGIFNSLWFFDFYLIIMTEKWKKKNRPFLISWASAVSEFEVLSSLAGFACSNDTFTFPEIVAEPYVIDFKELSHPLILNGKRVYNDFAFHGRGEIALITGSNMAGKSTFLRSVGINLVLAFMGAPCCARSGRVSHLKIFTSMRTQDNLEEGISSFYAELKRIEQLLKLVESGEPVFFLLDEMFKGTNSQDRYAGGASLIKQLAGLNAFGIISTHDLELAKLTANQKNITNYSFNSEINDDEIIFNYRLTKGICTDFNARALMKRSGIKIISDTGNISEL
ncbi:MutS-related protein [Dyadobacter sp. CY356]|uniref:MutS-related protein n=1 Tax=Dyadobacter sp. CY356 TaxID=2906442 RepID=UPI001F208E7F|nr:DNA mismatch repair protein MutS [Dyadobacter sp. CY356]MCF0056321.1 DNA mismatch repair protein MutS [Dyadobacter sp. CY356]